MLKYLGRTYKDLKHRVGRTSGASCKSLLTEALFWITIGMLRKAQLTVAKFWCTVGALRLSLSGTSNSFFILKPSNPS